jgi:glycosyltransferase involved in cell wall biosynthesis
VLTNQYPSQGDLYRNGFVHRRIVSYRQRGVRVDVFRLRPGEPVSYHEFENVDCITGSQEALQRLLGSGSYDRVLVHFLDPAMWEVLDRHIDRIKVVVWVHGAEIQPYHRRDYNYRTDEERKSAKAQSEQRLGFWRGLLRTPPASLKLVFVSRHFAEEVMDDLGFRISPEHYEIIHNPIDVELFSYQPKPVEQRKKVLSIRPYASLTYANDISVKAILELARTPLFQDLEFRLIGDGPLFEATLEPLRRFANVVTEKRFLSQAEIAELHKEYGIFLCPSRMDSHGVSRDEAMASGLVPVTNRVAAIPEFVDDTCGILAPAEDHAAMAAGIARLVENPALFAQMSAAAAERVRRQSSAAKIVDAELRLVSQAVPHPAR